MRRISIFIPVAAVAFTATQLLFGTNASAQNVMALDHSNRETPGANRVIQLRPMATFAPATPIQTAGGTTPSVQDIDIEKFPNGALPAEANQKKDSSPEVPAVLKSTTIVPPQVAEETLANMQPLVAPKKQSGIAPQSVAAAVDEGKIQSPLAGKMSDYTPAKPTKPLSVTKNAPTINTHIEAPGYINLNQPATIRIKLQNVSDTNAGTVKLIATLPAHAKFSRATPNPTSASGSIYEFQLTNMVAHQIREIAIDLIPTEKTPLEIGTEVVVENTQRFAVGVREPKIKISLQGPAEANMGQTVNHKVLLENTGDGMAEQIQLHAEFPAELQCSKKSEVTIPTLEPGQSVVIEMPSLAALAGESEINVNVSATGVDAQSVKAPIRIFEPELEVSCVGPEMNFVNRDGMYSIKLDNTGEVDATNVKIQLKMPRGMEVTTISREADVDPENGMLVWTFDRIPAKTEQTIMLKTIAKEAGQQVCNITVRSKETRDKEIHLSTLVATRADLNVVVVNQSGPIQVGGKTQFSVVIENKGSDVANDISVNVELPESLLPEQQDGVDVLGFGNGIHFQDAKIEPGQKREFVFTAIANKQGEHVVRSTLQAAGSDRQILAEGSVYVYEINQSRVSEALSPAIIR